MTRLTQEIKTLLNKLRPKALIGDKIDTLIADDNANAVAHAAYDAHVALNHVYQAVVTASLAEINAGKILIPLVAGKTISVMSYLMEVTGAFATVTDIRIQDSNGTPVIVTTALTAALTNGAKIGSYGAVANVTNGAGFAAAATAAKNIVVAATGTAMTGGTSIRFILTYTLS